VEGVDLEVEVRSLLFDSLTHLGGGLVGEVEGEDLSCGYSLIDEPEYFLSVMTRVLPEPGPARMSWKPQAVTALVWEGLRGIQIVWLVRGGKKVVGTDYRGFDAYRGSIPCRVG
jgi:hypothetical protein